MAIKLRKAVILMASALMTVGTVGCSKKTETPALNANRGTDYTYDFINYMDVSFLGNDGSGSVEVTPKDISVKDFESEDDYIAVKKLLEEIDLTYKPATGDSEEVTSEYFSVTPAENLSNGDIVTFAIDPDFKNESNVSINLEPYQYQITDLGNQAQLDLFGESNVIFYGLEGTNEVYAAIKEDSDFPEELKDNIQYKITPDSQKLEVDKTILSIDASLNDEFLKQDDADYRNLSEYLLKKGYQSETSKDKVLTTIVGPTNFNKVANKKNMAAAITKAIQENLENSDPVYSLVNIQRSTTAEEDPEQTSVDRYTYYVIFWVRNADTGESKLKAAQVRMVEVDGEMQVLEVTNIADAQSDYETQAIPNYTIVYQFENTTLNNLSEGNSEETEDTETSSDSENSENTENNNEGEDTSSKESESTVSPETDNQKTEESTSENN